MASAATLASWYPDGTAKAKQLTGANVFERNLESALDLRRAEGGFFKIQKGLSAPDSVDFSTLDVLSLTSSGTMRRAYLEELARHPEFKLNDGSSRLMSDSAYTDAAEREIAAFHGAETALMLKSGWDANGAIMTAIPRPGDAIVYDELIHASVHEGMNLSLAATKVAFKHNDVESFREVLLNIRETQQLVREGKRCVLVSVESVYSMDGDVVPLREMVQIGKEIFPEGVVQFIIDEAHSTGVIGEGGKGLVNELGLEKEIAVRMHTYGKALATSGGGKSYFVFSLIHGRFTNHIFSCRPLHLYSTRDAGQLRPCYHLLQCAPVLYYRCHPSGLHIHEVGTDRTRKTKRRIFHITQMNK